MSDTSDTIPPEPFECSVCGNLFELATQAEPDMMLCSSCMEKNKPLAMTIYSSEGKDVVYVSPQDEDLKYCVPAEEEIDFAEEVVAEIEGGLGITLDEDKKAYLQELIEDSVISIRESILFVAKAMVNEEEYERLARQIRGDLDET